MNSRRLGDIDARGRGELRNPFDFWFVLLFALFLGIVVVVARAIGESFGATGAIFGAAVVGLADVDAVTVAMAKLVPQTLTSRGAALAILAAVTTDTIGKIALGAFIAGGRFALEIAVMAAVCILSGAAALWGGLALWPA